MPQDISPPFDRNTFAASGFCASCNTVHSLGSGTALQSAKDLIRLLDTNKNLGLFSEDTTKDSAFTTAPLWGEPRGKMFGVMDCIDSDKKAVTLYAFSGQYNGRWKIDGWVPPLFDVERFYAISSHVEKEIKALGREINSSPAQSKEWSALRKERRDLSRELMREIFDLYRVTNFKGQTRPLTEIFHGSDKIPTGTGDCCAPKLLNFAAQNGLTPTGICEFFYGRETKSGSHSHGQFSSSCTEKCEPILGFMLCGLDNCEHGKSQI